jgi:adenine phosphoribosyltransferase
MGGKHTTSDGEVLALLRGAVRDVPNFPKPGIVFKDITPVLADPDLLRAAVRLLGERAHTYQPQGLVAIESRGFLFGAPLADRLGLPLHLVRKPGKLPYKTAGYDYELEYGRDRLEIHIDAIERGHRYLVVDDLLATGGTAAATAHLIEQQGGEVVCCAFAIELSFLKGRERLTQWPVERLVAYGD